jgi:hypothetical protein
MKQVVIFISIIAAMLLFILVTAAVNLEFLERKTYDEAVKIVAALQSYYTQTQTYPTSIEQFLLAHNLTNHIRSGFLSATITIKADAKGFEVAYYQHPLGPFHEYHSQLGEWIYLE